MPEDFASLLMRCFKLGGNRSVVVVMVRVNWVGVSQMKHDHCRFGKPQRRSLCIKKYFESGGAQRFDRPRGNLFVVQAFS